jgi:DNA-binding NarL/FixJ family response regulator
MCRMSVSLVLVDDHESFRAEARALLEEDGFRIVGEAADGLGALEVIRDAKPDVVLLDIVLPDIDGFEVADRLASDSPGTHVVLISSRDAGDYRAHLARSSAVGFISKADLSGDALVSVLEGDA